MSLPADAPTTTDDEAQQPRSGGLPLPRHVFMVIEHYRPGQAAAVYRRFRDRGRMAPEGVRYVDSWVDLEFRRCFQVMEASSEAELREWTRHWDDLVEFEIVPVRTSREAAAAIQGEL